MPTSYRPYAPDQDLLLQPCLQEWLPEGHLSYFINDVIEELDLRAFYKPYEGDGRREADTARGRHEDDDRRPPGGRGGSYKRDFGVPADKAQSNFTDPESSIMNTAEGYQQCYNGQLAVDRDFQIIVENKLTANGSERAACPWGYNGELLDVLTGVESNLEKRLEAVLADAGYRDESRFQALEQRHIDGYIALGGKHKDPDEIDGTRFPASRRMAEKLAGANGRECYAERKWISEAVNGWIKRILGFRQFSVRGLNNASGEWDLLYLATNLRRMQPLIVLQ